MKRILLLAVTISLFGYITAQNDTWKVYLQGHAVKSIAFENQYVWVATDSFLVRLNKTFDKGTTYYSYPFINENGDSYKLKIDKNGVKWLARSEYLPEGKSIHESYDSSIYSFDGNQWKKVKAIGYGEITSLAIDKSNYIWIAADGKNNIYKIDQVNCVQYTPENSGLIYDYVAQVASDNDGNIWLYNYGGYFGLIAADFALIKNDGDNWISCFSGRGVWFLVNMSIDSLGNPWVSNIVFLRKFDVASNSCSEQIILDSNNPFMLLAIEGSNRVWGLTHNVNGIAVYDGLNWSYYTTANSVLPSDMVYEIAIDADGTKWLGTANGLVAFNENGLLSTTDHSKLMNEVVLYPNPTKDFITLKVPDELQNSTVDILNIKGRTIKTFFKITSQKLIDVSSIPSGIYFVRIQSDGNYTVKKFIKR